MSLRCLRGKQKRSKDHRERKCHWVSREGDSKGQPVMEHRSVGGGIGPKDLSVVEGPLVGYKTQASYVAEAEER